MLLVIWVLFIRWVCPIALLVLTIAIYQRRKERGFLWLAIAAGSAVATEVIETLVGKLVIAGFGDPELLTLMGALSLPFIFLLVGAGLLLIDSRKEPIQSSQTTTGSSAPDRV